MAKQNIRLNRFHKSAFYAANTVTGIIPWAWWSQRRDRILSELQSLSPETRETIMERVRYYNRLHQAFDPAPESEPIRAFSPRNKSSAYYFDLRNVIRYFPRHARVAYQLGDVTTVPEHPCFVKSRPISDYDDNAHSVLLKLNTVRHYLKVEDNLAFEEKRPLAVWRGKSNHPERIAFARKWGSSSLCDVGCVRHKETGGQPYLKPFMSIPEQLNHQFIVSVEGIDVATNLKWIMASNSLCMMRRPRYETWFMEGSLQAGIHYVELNDDFSDLEDKITYYRNNPEEAKTIIKNAQRYSARFSNHAHERLISLLVIDRYLRLSGQI
ncbi:MAG: Glycosyl transferase family 90 [Marinobacter excellens HL-55]|uniref:Glycosyl transferase family 90 n=1 Tax=Marinobacter excellens HL-55 TaxID=1305731 RepID=A0A0P8BI53_9GAMM|nr:MAG: Glycosyl transferase family 90 [Marinobacter excellens HL-55]